MIDRMLEQMDRGAIGFMLAVWAVVLLCAGYCFLKVIFSKRRLDSDE